MHKKYLPIGVFDSGAGGITVLKTCAQVLPNENFLYYGDTKNSPYGNLSDQQITELTFCAVDKLISKGVKAVVIACNTATAAAINALRAKHNDLDIIGIEPAIKPACLKTDGKVLVLLTQAAARQDKFRSLIQRCGLEKIIVCPLKDLAQKIEHNIDDFNKLRPYIFNILRDYQNSDIKAVVLGCTHYIFVRDLIAQVFPNAVLYDGNTGVANRIKDLLSKKDLLNDANQKQIVELYSSDSKYQLIYQNLWQKYSNNF
ncbi:MAG TPA: glutamate racemase [Clostridia bacterium]